MVPAGEGGRGDVARTSDPARRIQTRTALDQRAGRARPRDSPRAAFGARPGKVGSAAGLAPIRWTRRRQATATGTSPVSGFRVVATGRCRSAASSECPSQSFRRLRLEKGGRFGGRRDLRHRMDCWPVHRLRPSLLAHVTQLLAHVTQYGTAGSRWVVSRATPPGSGLRRARAAPTGAAASGSVTGSAGLEASADREASAVLGLSAMAASTALTSNGVRPGCPDRIRATNPATCGAAKLLPVPTVVPPSFQASGTSHAPGPELHRWRRVVVETPRIGHRVRRDGVHRREERRVARARDVVRGAHQVDVVEVGPVHDLVEEREEGLAARREAEVRHVHPPLDRPLQAGQERRSLALEVGAEHANRDELDLGCEAQDDPPQAVA